jgi:hypothetical protein
MELIATRTALTIRMIKTVPYRATLALAGGSPSLSR